MGTCCADLEYLAVESSEQQWTITEATLAHFVFPKLRYFVLDVYVDGEVGD